MSDLLRRAGLAIGAVDVSMWLIDYGQAFLEPSDDGRGAIGHSDGTIPVTGTRRDAPLPGRADRVRSSCSAPLGADPRRHRAIGRASVRVPRTIDGDQRRLSDALTSLGGELLVGKRPHTDRYEMQRRQQEMNLAAELQWQQLPPLESSTPAAAVAGFVEPAYGVGGDGFDYSINGDIIDLTIYDAVGHGLHSALLSTLMIASLRHGRRLRLGLAERLAVADEAIGASFPATSSPPRSPSCRRGTGRLDWANAGHPLPMLVRDGVVVGELTCAPRPPVGLHPLHHAPTIVETVQLQRSDRVLFYTDGLVEGGRRGGSRFGVERLADLLAGRTPKAWGVLRRSGNWDTRSSSTPTTS